MKYLNHIALAFCVLAILPLMVVSGWLPGGWNTALVLLPFIIVAAFWRELREWGLF